MSSKFAIETVFSLVDRITAPMSKIDGKAKAVNRSLKNMYAGAERAAARMGGAFKRLGSTMLRMAGITALLNPAAVINIVTRDIRNAMGLADTMAMIGSSANITGPPLERLQANIASVANRSGAAVNELANIANAAIGFGVAADASADFAGVVAKTARVTGASTDTVVAGITNVLAAYGKGAGEGSRVAGIMATAGRMGRTSMQEMAYGMRYAIPAAASLGVQAEDVFASVTALTAGGITTRDAMQSVGKALGAVRKPSRAAADMAQRLGVDFSEAALQSKGFAGFMDEISRKTGGDMRAMEALFGNERTARSMSILAGTGAEAFREALDEMSNAAGMVAAEFARVTDTPAERWRKAVNRIQNSGVQLGTALLPVVERIIARLGDMADRLSGVDFSRFAPSFERAFRVANVFISALFGVVGIAWRLRGAIIAVAAAVGAYYAASMLLVGAAKAVALWHGVKQAAIFAATLATKGQKAAVATLAKQTVAYNAIQKFLIAKTLVMAAKTKIATAAQWLFNIALKANPIGLVITLVGLLVGAIILLAANWNRVTEAVRNNAAKVSFFIAMFTGPFGMVISMVRELFGNWSRVADAFKDGGILAAIKQIGRTLLSGLLAPVQGLLEILSNLPGLGRLAGRGADKIAGLRNSLLGEGSEITANTRQGRRREREALAAAKPPQLEYDPSPYQRALRSAEAPNLAIPGFDMPRAPSLPDMPSPSAGGPRLRGVVDISSGAAAAAVPNFSRGGAPGTFTANQPAAPSVSVQEAIRAAAYGTNGVLREILASTRAIETATAAPSSLPAPPRPATAAGGTERERAAAGDPRNIAPVTREERIAHSIRESRETLAIELTAAQGTQARVTRAPKSPNIQLVHSGGNAQWPR